MGKSNEETNPEQYSILINLMCEDDAEAMAAGKASGRAAANARGRVGRHTGASAEAGSIHVGALSRLPVVPDLKSYGLYKNYSEKRCMSSARSLDHSISIRVSKVR
jgi:hypothetical protein